MNDLTECDQFTDHRRLICRGERPDLPLDGPQSINAYRVKWGLLPLRERMVGSDCGDVLPVSANAPQVAETATTTVPGLIQQVVTFTAALKTHLKDGLTRCDVEQIESRLAVCQECPEFTGKQCRQCGCACNAKSTFFNKLAWRSEKCPLSRW